MKLTVKQLQEMILETLIEEGLFDPKPMEVPSDERMAQIRDKNQKYKNSRDAEINNQLPFNKYVSKPGDNADPGKKGQPSVPPPVPTTALKKKGPPPIPTAAKKPVVTESIKLNHLQNLINEMVKSSLKK